jgi:hypothetical protein
MSTIARQSSQRDALERAKTPRALAIRWEIGPRALLVSRGAAMLNGHAAKLRTCALVIEIEGDAANAWLDVVLSDGVRERIAVAPRVAVARRAEQGLEFVEATGVVDAVIRERGDEVRVLFARTPLLERALGLPGGVYDAPATSQASCPRP